MGIKGAFEIESGLLQSMDPQTPVGIIQNATLKDQRDCITSLNRLCETIDQESLKSPSVIVIGDILKGLSAYRDNQPSPCENSELAAG